MCIIICFVMIFFVLSSIVDPLFLFAVDKGGRRICFSNDLVCSMFKTLKCISLRIIKLRGSTTLGGDSF